MSATEFFTRFAELLKDNPPHANDYPILDRLKRIGIKPGKSFDPESAPREVKDAVEAAPRVALPRIKAALKDAGDVVNGWRIYRTGMGTYGTDYLQRAAVAYAGLGANVVEDAIYPTAFTDEEGQALDSDNRYVVHFDKEQIPPVHAFWSLTMYDERQAFAANAIDRFALGDRDALAFGSDGSLDLYIQRDSPGSERESNWLPAPRSGLFTMNLRLYWPKDEALTGAWGPPPVKRVR